MHDCVSKLDCKVCPGRTVPLSWWYFCREGFSGAYPPWMGSRDPEQVWKTNCQWITGFWRHTNSLCDTSGCEELDQNWVLRSVGWKTAQARQTVGRTSKQKLPSWYCRTRPISFIPVGKLVGAEILECPQKGAKSSFRKAEIFGFYKFINNQNSSWRNCDRACLVASDLIELFVEDHRDHPKTGPKYV